jgi:hypothetical protein
VAKIPECSAQSCIAPARICSGHLNYELGDVSLRWWSAWAPCRGSVVLLGDEIAIPTKQSIRRYDAGDSI